MAEITKKSLVLTFGTVGSKEVNLTIASPSETLEAGQIASAMNSIVATGAYGDGDSVDKKLAAKYVMQQVEAVELV